jgi:hypothetical protein
MPARSKTQQRLFGQALALKTGEISKRDLDPRWAQEIANLADSMSVKKLRDFAKTKHKNLPEKVKEAKILSFVKFINEELDANQITSLENLFNRAKVTPKTEKQPLSKDYYLLFIQCSDYIENLEGERGKFLVVDLDYGSMITVHESMQDAIWCLDEDRYDGDLVREYLVNLIEYNDVNYQEIENILFDFGIHLENIWVFPT